MRRRELMAGLGAAAAVWPLGSRAQQGERLPRVGLLFVNNADQERMLFGDDPFGFRDLGYIDGQTIALETRYADGDPNRLISQARELVALGVDVIVTGGPGVYAARGATATIPIVAATAGDLVADGFAANLARPGGNVTGSAIFTPKVTAKRLEMLKAMVPSMSRTGVLLLRGLPSAQTALKAMEPTAKALDIVLAPIEVSGPSEFEDAFSAAAAARVGGMVITDPAPFLGNAALLAELALKHKLPALAAPASARAGALLGYGVRMADLFHHAATFVDKILKGARPGDIPIEQATRFETVVNLKTAAALAITIPPNILAAADEVIE